MLVNFRFFDKESWSIYATLNVIIPLIAFKICNLNINSQSMIFMSILAMIQGDLLPKIIMTGFLNFLVYEPNWTWVIRSIIYVFSIILFHYIPTEHSIHTFIKNNIIIKYSLFAIILVWMGFIIKPSFMWAKHEITKFYKKI
jgi:hypothetical protein